MEKIDAVLYINLDYRTDRNDHILNEISKVCKDSSKIHRIDAIKTKQGALGCGLSHIKALQFALEHSDWNTIMIVEDDFTFRSNDSNEILNDFTLLVRTNFDVALLAYNDHYKFVYSSLDNLRLIKIQRAQTTSGYIIKRQYIQTLINKYQEAINDMKTNGVKHENCIDQYWTQLQLRDNWIALYPAIGYQYPNYSDIEETYAAYNC